MITGTAHTALVVREYEEAIEFYCGKLGFIVVEDTQLKNKRWIRLRAPGGAGSEILLSRAVDDKQRASIGNQTGGRVLFFFHTDDFDSDYERFRELGPRLSDSLCAKRNKTFAQARQSAGATRDRRWGEATLIGWTGGAFGFVHECAGQNAADAYLHLSGIGGGR